MDTGDRLDQLFAMLQATIANVNRGRNQRPYKADQFVPQWGVESENVGPMTGEDMLRAAQRMTRQSRGSREAGSGNAS